MDTLEFTIYLQALWAIPSILAVIDMDQMLRAARENDDDRAVDLILALRALKEERHEP